MSIHESGRQGKLKMWGITHSTYESLQEYPLYTLHSHGIRTSFLEDSCFPCLSNIKCDIPMIKRPFCKAVGSLTRQRRLPWPSPRWTRSAALSCRLRLSGPVPRSRGFELLTWRPSLHPSCKGKTWWVTMTTSTYQWSRKQLYKQRNAQRCPLPPSHTTRSQELTCSIGLLPKPYSSCLLPCWMCIGLFGCLKNTFGQRRRHCRIVCSYWRNCEKIFRHLFRAKNNFSYCRNPTEGCSMAAIGKISEREGVKVHQVLYYSTVP